MLKWLAIVVGVAVGATLAGAIIYVNVEREEIDRRQAALAPFYTPPEGPLGAPGDVIRTEPLGVDVAGATAWRMLYTSQRPDGTAAVSGAMVFIPEVPAPDGGRPVVAWAHGTVGMGDQCAPSRSEKPLNNTDNWLDQMMSLGWVVVATDYVGLGTPGPELYLVAEAEARDVVNSVRAVRNLPTAEAGSEFAVWGHSQGGHSSLWTGHLAEQLAPELDLLGVAAAAPVGEVIDIVGAQWDTPVGWAIGPEVAVAWPSARPELSTSDVLTKTGSSNYRRLAGECIVAAALEGEVRAAFKSQFFSIDPTTQPDWAAVAQDETPPPLPPEMPVFIAQGTADKVVLPWPNAILQEQWCASGSTLSMLWLGGVGHVTAATTAGPSAVTWIADRFAGRPATATCDIPPPVPAAQPNAD